VAQPQPEKRSTRRFALDLPITIKFPDNARQDANGRTRDVSSRGVFMYLDAELGEGATVDFVLTLPTEVTLADPLRVQCSGRVLRVENKAKERGIAVAIEKYDFIREE
jgi:hypothetical protein